MSGQLETFPAYYEKEASETQAPVATQSGYRYPARQLHQGQKELTVTLYQATVLLLFNSADALTLAKIRAQTKMARLFRAPRALFFC